MQPRTATASRRIERRPGSSWSPKWHEAFDNPEKGPSARFLLDGEHKLRIYEGDEELDEKLVRKELSRTGRWFPWH